MKKLEGIIAPMATAITHDEKIDAKTTRTLVDFLIDGGIDGLFPLGTSGEFALFDREERKKVVATPPYYFATGEDGLFNHFETIARKSELPLVVYNIPEWTHLFVPPSVIR